MADTYSVTPAMIAAELPGLFPGGFSATSVPTAAQVEEFISTADLIAAQHVRTATGDEPATTGVGAAIAKRYIAASTKAEIISIVYLANDPERVDAATRSFLALMKTLLVELDALAAEEEGDGQIDLPGASLPSGTTELVPSWF